MTNLPIIHASPVSAVHEVDPDLIAVRLHPNFWFVMPKPDQPIAVGDYLEVHLHRATQYPLAVISGDPAWNDERVKLHYLHDGTEEFVKFNEFKAQNEAHVARCSELLLNQVMLSMPESWRRRWCENKICGCMGGANCSGSASMYGFTKQRWMDWVSKHYPDEPIAGVAVTNRALYTGTSVPPEKNFPESVALTKALFQPTFKHYDVVAATFKPKDENTLRPEARPVIGKYLVWQASWVVEDGPYKDQWAFVYNGSHRDQYQIGWVPACDLDDIKPLRRALPQDIVVNAQVYVLGDDTYMHDRVIREVLKPDDDFKAFCADDGCRYGLDSTYVAK